MSLMKGVMNSSQAEDIKVRYLLGDLTEDQRLVFEEQFLANDELFHDVLEAETDLIDAYVDDVLTPEERQKFELRFLTVPDRRARVEVARVLRLRMETGREADTEKKSGGGKLIAFRPKLLGIPRTWFAVAAGLLLAASIGAIVMLTRPWSDGESRKIDEVVRTDQNPDSLDRKATDQPPTDRLPAEIPAPAAPSAPHPAPSRSTLLTVVLSGGLTRGQGGLPRVTVPAGTGRIQFRLPVEDATEFVGFQASLRTLDGQAVASRDKLRAGSRGTVAVVLPADRLKPGTYVWTLSGVSTSGTVEEIEDYAFQVTIEKSQP